MDSKLSFQTFILYDSNSMTFWKKRRMLSKQLRKRKKETRDKCRSVSLCRDDFITFSI